MDATAWRGEARVLMLDEPLPRELERKLGELTRLALRVALSVLHDREDAEEVAQEAMLTAVRKARTIRKPERFRSWLVRVTWRLALDRRRSKARRERREKASDAQDPPPSPEELATSAELKDHVWRAIDALPEKHRQALVLYAIEGHDLRSVASLLSVPVGTVKSRLHKARTKLLETLRWIADGSDLP
jgi:RNA polymerase sigma-70 factor (ECF subfamily)